MVIHDLAKVKSRVRTSLSAPRKISSVGSSAALTKRRSKVQTFYLPPEQFRTSKHGVGRGLLILEAWFDSKVRSHFIASVAQRKSTRLITERRKDRYLLDAPS